MPAILLVIGVASMLGLVGEQSPAPRTERTDALRIYGIDPASSLESRVQNTPAAVLKMFADTGQPIPTPHNLTDRERRTVSTAFAALPPLHRRILGERLRSVSFLDGMPNSALTSTVNPNEPFAVFDITVRAGVLGENVSELLTQKERTCFDAAGSPLNVFVEAGTLDALVYVLLHETTHVVDSTLRVTAPTQVSSFTDGVWSDRTILAPPYRDALLERIRFRAGGELLPIDRAETLYTALRRTPFVSLYGSSNWHDDVAEWVTWHYLTEKLEQPYRIVIRRAEQEIFAYEPMKAPLVRNRSFRID